MHSIWNVKFPFVSEYRHIFYKTVKPNKHLKIDYNKSNSTVLNFSWLNISYSGCLMCWIDALKFSPINITYEHK